MVPFCLCEALNVIKNNINNFPVGCSGSIVYVFEGGRWWLGRGKQALNHKVPLFLPIGRLCGSCGNFQIDFCTCCRRSENAGKQYSQSTSH